jgi:hypothetical protein
MLIRVVHVQVTLELEEGDLVARLELAVLFALLLDGIVSQVNHDVEILR